jgi:hypothetical protein
MVDTVSARGPSDLDSAPVPPIPMPPLFVACQSAPASALLFALHFGFGHPAPGWAALPEIPPNHPKGSLCR